MKAFLVISTLLIVASAGRLESNYLPPQAVSGVNPRIPQSIQRPGKSPAIIRLTNDNKGDGRYKFDFETENRIAHQEVGELKNAGTDHESNVIQGMYSYTGPDGVVYTVNYIADENGFRASGDHIPTAAPIPVEIAAAVQQTVSEEAAGIMDDGQYRPAEHGAQAHVRRGLRVPTSAEGYRY